MKREVQQGILQVVPIPDVHAERDLCMIWLHDSSFPAAVRVFLEVLHEQAPARSGTPDRTERAGVGYALLA
jgi:DNA-binding transcriptional LysR family regulator